MGGSQAGKRALKLIRRRVEEASIMELRDQLQGTLGAAYSLDHELSGGGMSRIFAATETAFGRSVVVKVLPPDLVNTVSMERFRREIRLSASLQHPNIVPVLTTGESSGVPYYTMPLVAGNSLRTRLREAGALPTAEAVGIMLDVAKALAYAHAHGVVHRDIKPENILLSGGTALVTDFGIAKAIWNCTGHSMDTTLTAMGTTVGTPEYISPEQAAADPAIDHRADIYSFGCVAYEMLAGQPPFVGMTPQRILKAQRTQAPTPVTEFRADVSPALAALVMRCLEKQPARRPRNAEQLVQVLESSAVQGGGQSIDIPAALLVQVALGKTMAVYVIATIAILLGARAAIAAFGLPGWVLTTLVVVMAIGLPIVLLGAFMHYATRRAAAESPSLGADASRSRMVVLAERLEADMRRRFGKDAGGEGR
jgi:tRNA A-37 threonylcarbamoyl transferase component Bud32